MSDYYTVVKKLKSRIVRAPDDGDYLSDVRRASDGGRGRGEEEE